MRARCARDGAPRPGPRRARAHDARRRDVPPLRGVASGESAGGVAPSMRRISSSRVRSPDRHGEVSKSQRVGSSPRQPRDDEERTMDSDRVEGKTKQLEGEAQEGWGKLKDTARDVKDDAKDALDRDERRGGRGAGRAARPLIRAPARRTTTNRRERDRAATRSQERAASGPGSTSTSRTHSSTRGSPRTRRRKSRLEPSTRSAHATARRRSRRGSRARTSPPDGGEGFAPIARAHAAGREISSTRRPGKRASRAARR